jgi:hypothetical protein
MMTQDNKLYPDMYGAAQELVGYLEDVFRHLIGYADEDDEDVLYPELERGYNWLGAASATTRLLRRTVHPGYWWELLNLMHYTAQKAVEAFGEVEAPYQLAQANELLAQILGEIAVVTQDRQMGLRARKLMESVETDDSMQLAIELLKIRGVPQFTDDTAEHLFYLLEGHDVSDRPQVVNEELRAQLTAMPEDEQARLRSALQWLKRSYEGIELTDWLNEEENDD